MNNACRTNTAGEKLRINTDIRARVHDNSAAKTRSFSVAAAPRDQHKLCKRHKAAGRWERRVRKPYSQQLRRTETAAISGASGLR